MVPAPAGTRRVAQVDALRALAAGLVLVTHATEVFRPHALAAGHSTWLYTAAHAVDLGRIGVIVFFLISGYVVANTLDNPATTVPRFLVRRFFRLYPLFWLSVAAACVVFFHGIVDPATFAANLTMLPTVLGREPYLGLYWTLETELAFYLVAVGLLSAGLLRQAAVLAAGVAALIGLFAAFMFGLVPAPANLSWKSFPLNLSFMLIGVLAHVWHSGSAPGGRRGARAYLLAAGAIALAPSAYCLLQYFRAGGADDLRWGVSYPAAVALFFALLDSRARVLEPLAAVGLVSYSMYLLHPFALALVDKAIVPWAVVVDVAGPLAAVALAVAATIAFSTATYVLVEAPVNRLARRLTSSRPPPRSGRYAVR